MNLQEYLNQENPKALPSGYVGLSQDEIKVHGTIGRITSVTIKALKLTYYVINSQGVLWTQNENGTPKSVSVFSLIEPLN